LPGERKKPRGSPQHKPKHRRRAKPRAGRRGELVEAVGLEQPVEPPTPAEEWREAVDRFRELLQLETRTARRQVRRLMLALDREALMIFKVARQLEDPSVTPKNYDRLRVYHGRSGIVARLREDLAERHVALAHLDDLDERIGAVSTHWYRQGGMILDRVEMLRVGLAVYEWQLRAIRRRPGGRAPSVAWDFLVEEQERRGLSDEEVMRSLVRVGYAADQEVSRISLQENIRKHRQRLRARLRARLKTRDTT
jgi:hypothetical protein